MAITRTSSRGEPPPKKPRIDLSEEVIVLVGQPETRFICHPKLLSAASPFFQARIENNLGKTICLTNQEPSAFSIYLHWRYTGVLDLWDGKPSSETCRGTDGYEHEIDGGRMSMIVDCYILGTELKDDRFRNLLTDAQLDLSESTHNVPGPCIINHAFNSLSRLSKLVQLMIRQIAYEATASIFERDIADYNPGVLQEIARMSIAESSELPNRKRADKKNRCFFHIHQGGEGECK